MAEQDDDLVRLTAGAVRLGDRAVGPDQHRPSIPYRWPSAPTTLPRPPPPPPASPAAPGSRTGPRRHSRPHAGLCRPPAPAEPGRGGQPGQHRPALGDDRWRSAGQMWGDGKPPPIISASRSTTARDRPAGNPCPPRCPSSDRRCRAGPGTVVQATIATWRRAAPGQRLELTDLDPHEVLAVRMHCTGNQTAASRRTSPTAAQVDRPGQLGQPPPRPSRAIASAATAGPWRAVHPPP